jgi:Lar family restriction alleviation protein
MTDLLSCPFCGGVKHEIGYDSAGFDVQCHSWTCRAKTGSHTTEAEAIAAWNRRAALPVSREAVGVTEEAKLVAFFNEPAAYSRWGWEGDKLSLSPAETAIRALRAALSSSEHI